ncbi:two-component sensor histidine kinase [Enterobacterales bacterium CwR94]|nr:two-component sensor histidine kinase [Enterobacterales bacterium CwR94]
MKGNWKAGFAIWLLLCLLTAIAMGVWQVRQLHQHYNDTFYTLQRTLSNLLTQNETFLPLLSGDESLETLRHKFPQVVAIEKIGERPLQGERVEPASDGRYWLYNPYRRTRFLIDLQEPLNQTQPFHYLALTWHQQVVVQRGDKQAGSFWQWRQQLTHPLQPFTLQAEANPQWQQLPLLPMLLMSGVWFALIATVLVLLHGRKEKRQADERAHYYQHSRLNALGEITAGMVHEINQPLTAIQNYVHSAQRLVAKQNYALLPDALTAVLTQTQRIGDLLKRFRDNVSQKEVQLEAVNIVELTSRVASLLEREIRLGQIQLRTQFLTGSERVCADALWLEQIFHNLISNAVQAQQGQPQGMVSVASARDGEQVEIRITDAGPGFSDEALAQAFMPFYTTRKEGIGLGMPLTETLILRMNGQIALSNLPAGGACVTVRLPVAKE